EGKPMRNVAAVLLVLCLAGCPGRHDSGSESPGPLLPPLKPNVLPRPPQGQPSPAANGYTDRQRLDALQGQVDRWKGELRDAADKAETARRQLADQISAELLRQKTMQVQLGMLNVLQQREVVRIAAAMAVGEALTQDQLALASRLELFAVPLRQVIAARTENKPPPKLAEHGVEDGRDLDSLLRMTGQLAPLLQ